MNGEGRRIGLFGGAFAPPHKGHVKAAESFLDSKMIDLLEILPTAHPPHKENESSTSFNHRCAMLDLAFSEMENVEMNKIEKSLPKPSFTLQTICYLQDKNPQNIYFLCIGEDNLATFHKWYKYREILQLVTLLVAVRPGTDSSEQKDEILEKSVFIEHEEIEVSSTEIRTSRQPHVKTDSIPEKVANYIKKHELYAKGDI